ncbi:hypothetical protein PMAYCL1PPCAC_01133, partial [Pristionchus mayeri]
TFLRVIILVHFSLQGTLVTVRLTSPDPCQAQISKKYTSCEHIYLCDNTRAINLIFTGAHFQRIVSTLTSNEIIQIVFSRFMILLSFVYPAVVCYLSYRMEMFEGRVPYCTGATAGSTETSQWNLLTLFALDVVTLILDFCLLKYNQYKLKFDKSFHLAVTFRRRQNVYAIQQFLPSAMFHCVCYLMQRGGIISRLYYE